MAKVTGGDKLNNALAQIAAQLERGKTLRVGFLENATYPDGKSVAMIAAIQNYGAPSVGIPPRPFFSNMVRDKSPEWPAAVAKLLKRNAYNTVVTLQMVGMGIKGQLQQSIIDTNAPPLAPATIAARIARRVGKKINPKTIAKPLVDTGHMLNSVDYDVKT